MEKKLKKRAISLFEKRMLQELPNFTRTEEKSLYIWPDEVVWVKDGESAKYFVIFSPNAKGRDEFVIEIGWSKLHRFPELQRRPSLSFEFEFKDCYSLDEATARVSYFSEREYSPVVNEDNLEEVVAAQFAELREHGIPFLRGVFADDF